MDDKRKRRKDWQRIHHLLEVETGQPAAADDLTSAAAALLKEMEDIRAVARGLEGWEEVDVEGDLEKLKARIDPHTVYRRMPVWRKVMRYAAMILLPLLILGGAWLLIKQRAPSTTYITRKAPAGVAPMQILLPDNSQVWLNAGSELRYPAAFTGASREVEITAGEALLSVAPRAQQPFIVKVKKLSIQVLGTSFNVNAYGTNILITLLTGKIGIGIPGLEGSLQYLAPGQQAVYNADSGRLQVNAADTAATRAWQKGQLIFSDVPLPDLLQQLGRLYGYEILFRNGKLKTLHFNVPLMPKPATITPLLELINATTTVDIHFKIDTVKRTITVE